MPRKATHAPRKTSPRLMAPVLLSLPVEVVEERIMAHLYVKALVRLLCSSKTLLEKFTSMPLASSKPSEWFDARYWHILCTAQVSIRCAYTHTFHCTSRYKDVGSYKGTERAIKPLFTFYHYSDVLKQGDWARLCAYAKPVPFDHSLSMSYFIFLPRHIQAEHEERFNLQVEIFPNKPSSCLTLQLQKQFEAEMQQTPCLSYTASSARLSKAAFHQQLKIRNFMPGSFNVKIKQPALQFLRLWKNVARRFLENGDGDDHEYGGVTVLTPRFCTTCGTWMVKPNSDNECCSCHAMTVFTSPDIVRIYVQVDVACLHSFTCPFKVILL